VPWPLRVVSVPALGVVALSIMMIGVLAPKPPACFAETGGFLRLSWGTCDPQVRDAYLPGSVTRRFTLVVSATGITRAISANDVILRVGPGPIPDAWRYDDAGCETGSQLTYQVAARSPACPVFQGPHPLALCWFMYDAATQTGRIRFANTYDSFTPVPTARYTVCQITFDHSFSNLSGRVEPDSCGGGERPVCIAAESAELLPSVGPALWFAFADPLDQQVNFNVPACQDCAVPALPTSWGRVKATYR
jgi:hypothetical protein